MQVIKTFKVIGFFIICLLSLLAMTLCTFLYIILVIVPYMIGSKIECMITGDNIRCNTIITVVSLVCSNIGNLYLRFIKSINPND